MTNRYRSVRCKHGMCLVTVGCEVCGVKPKPGAGQHLYRCETRRLPNPDAPPTYKNQGQSARARG